MSSLGAYTTTEAVRAGLGMDYSDCPDKVMEESDLALELSVSLDTDAPTHAAVFAAGIAAGADAAAKRAMNILTLYAQWFCAYEIALRPLVFLQEASDGKNKARRFDFEVSEIREMAGAKKAHYLGLLDEVVNGASPATSEPYTLVSISVPDGDPVAGT